MFCFKCGTENNDNVKFCSNCGSDISSNKVPASQQNVPVDYEIGLLGIPLFGVVALVFWISNLSLIEGVSDKLMMTGILVVISTACLVALEVSKNSNKDNEEIGTPIYWMLCIVALWVVMLPEYLKRRAVFGLKNRLPLGVVLTLIFTYYFVTLNIATNEKKEEIRNHVTEFNQQLENIKKEFSGDTLNQVEPEASEENALQSKNEDAPFVLPPSNMATRQTNPSFDCNKASTNVEKLICSSEDLAFLDINVSQIYFDKLSKMTDDNEKMQFRMIQVAWKKERDKCGDIACLTNSYNKRFDELTK